MMKKLIVLLLFIQIICSQQLSKQAIKHSDQYYHGTGVSLNAEEARDLALSEMTSQIAVKVSSSFEEKLSESDTKVTESTQKILKTHSAATLRNVKYITSPADQGKVEVFCYLKKNEVEQIFNQRKKLICEIVNRAREYAREYNYAHALKHYYYANILLNSLPDQNVVYQGTNYTTLIPQKINALIFNTNFEYLQECDISDQEREITLRVHNDKHPIALLDFTFWDGSNQVSVQAKDGLASIRLVGSSIDFEKLRLNIQYSYYNSRKEYSVVADLWNLVTRPTYTATKTVELKKKALGGLVQRKAVVSKTDDFNVIFETEHDSAPIEKIANHTKELLSLFVKHDRTAIAQFCGSDTFLTTKLTDYIEYNNPTPQERNIGAHVNQTEVGWEVRKIRMLHRYPSIHKQSTEYLVLDFSEEGQLRDLNVAITKELYNKFVRQGDFSQDWDNRQQIVKFLEKYRTAYISRDIQTVEKMFAEDALIIVGRRIKRKAIVPEKIYQRMGNEPEYEYLRMKKAEYIERQRKIFDYQADIFLDFASFEINRKNDQPSIYGVEMRQNYFSTTYSDEGYLFLLIDFARVDPTIYVRAWQPNEWSADKLIRTANFKVYK